MIAGLDNAGVVLMLALGTAGVALRRRESPLVTAMRVLSVGHAAWLLAVEMHRAAWRAGRSRWPECLARARRAI
jgi:hypothetical protein